jgi:hypothetical protein
MWVGKRQQALDLIYRRFRDSGGTYPTVSDLQWEFDELGIDVDAARVVQRIPVKFLKPLSSAPKYPLPDERLIPTAEGVAQAAGSLRDMKNYVTSIRWLARQADRPVAPGDQGKRGMPFAIRELAAAVSLSLDSDRDAINRLIAILEAEGWLLDNGLPANNGDQVLYARWDVRACRSVNGYADIKKIKRRLKRSLNFTGGAETSRGWRRLWRALWSERGQMKIGTICAIALVLLALPPLIVLLL